MSNFEVISDTTHPIKMWTHGVPVEDKAREQLRNVADLPFVFKHIAVMPDCHWGRGATVGSVIATRNRARCLWRRHRLWNGCRTVVADGVRSPRQPLEYA